MRAGLRSQLRELFNSACGYCGVREADVGALLSVDHFQPRAHGGSENLDNLVYACHACNEFKGDYWRASGARRVLHPLRDDASLHIAPEEDGTLRDLTPAGAFHVERLRLNRPALIEHRRARQRLATAQTAQRALLAQLERLEVQVDQLIAQVGELPND